MWSYEEFISDRDDDEPLIAESGDGGTRPVDGTTNAGAEGECEEGREEHED